MQQKRSVRLLSITTGIYLIFTFLAFFASAYFLTRNADKFINRELEGRFWFHEMKTKHLLERNPEDLGQVHFTTYVKRLPFKPDLNRYPVYSDTLIYQEDQEEMQPFRKKILIMEHNEDYYRVEIIARMNDFLKLRDNIFKALVPAFIVLAIIIVLFNSFLAGYFFIPFNRILEQMKTFRVGEKNQVEEIKTNTREFMHMQELFHSMIDRIEKDYRNLKEYTENMAHEIQTPLTIIRNKSENLLSDETVMSLHSEDVKTIYEETNQLSKLGNTLNLLTKIENGEFNQAVRIRTREVIKKHVSAISESATLKSLTISTDLSDAHHLLIDPFLLDIVIKNLLRNALRYSTNEKPVKITSTPKSLTISNAGPPLEGTPEQLFKRFYRGPDSNTSLGLGLALVHKICELNRMHIKYSYEEGQHRFTLMQDDNPAS